MPGQITVDADLISAHAARVDTVAADIAVASDAAGSTNMGGGAFGVLCAFLVGPASFAASMAQQAIRSAEGMVQRSATELRGVATDMAAFEDDVMQATAALESQVR
jgi:hypothetical protein